MHSLVPENHDRDRNNVRDLHAKVDALSHAVDAMLLLGNGNWSDSGPAQSKSVLWEYWQAMKARRFLLAALAIAGLTAGFVLAKLAPPEYRAGCSIELTGINSDFMQLRQLDPNMPEAGADKDVETQIEVLRSAALLKRAVERLGLQKKPELLRAGFLPSVPSLLGGQHKGNRPVSVNEAAGLAARNLNVKARRGSRVLDISFSSPDPMLAASVPNTLAHMFIEYNLELRTKSGRLTSEWLGPEIESLRRGLEKSERELQNYARANGLVASEDHGNEKLRQLQSEYSRAQAERIAKQAVVEVAGARDVEPRDGFLESGASREIRTRLSDLQRQQAELRSALTPANPKVKRVEAQVLELQKMLRDESADLVKRAQSDYNAALTRERLLQRAYNSQLALVSEQAAKAIQYDILKRQVDTYRRLYDETLQKTKAADIASGIRATSARIVDAAEPSLAPNRSLAMSAVGMLGGLLLGSVIAILGRRWDASVRAPGDARHLLKMRELGAIPPINGTMTGPLRRLRLGTRLKARAPSIALDAPAPVRESFRAAMLSILFARRQNNTQVLVVTSPMSGDGKSTIASNLAVCLAEVREKVLLIDADLRRPRLGRAFDIADGPGLSEYLTGQAPLGTQELDRLVTPTRFPFLFVIPAGGFSEEAVRLLHSSRMGELLESLRQRFDLILLDTAPAFEFSDARALGRLADAAVLVLRSGKTSRESARTVLERFSDDDTHVLGTILNDYDAKHHGYSYYRGAAAGA